MTIEEVVIPEAPHFAEITLPSPPTITLPVLDVPDISEPILSEPSDSLLNFVYVRYARIINDMLERKIEDMIAWSGDPEYFADFANKATDQIMIEMVMAHKAILSKSAASGFTFPPGETVDGIVAVELTARAKAQEAGMQVHSELADTAMQFIEWAGTAGIEHVKIGVDENKAIVYANMSAIEAVVSSVLAAQKGYMEIFDGQIKMYQALIQSIDIEVMLEGLKVQKYSIGVQAARQKLAETDMLLDQLHAENLAIALNNSSTLLQANECLQNAELERQKVLQTHATLSGYLAEIKKAHSELVMNRSEVEVVLADLDYYKGQATLAEQQARAASAEIAGASSELSQLYQLSMGNVKKAKAEIQAAEERGRSSEIGGKLVTERYRMELSSSLLDCENVNADILSDNTVKVSEWIAIAEGKYTESYANMTMDHRIENLRNDSRYSVKQQKVKACAELKEAEWMSQADTELQLNQIISGA